jgi:hypothetical protein
LLAVYGREQDTGDLYVHIKVYKAGKLYAEIYTKHDIRLVCRECTRWHNIVIRNGRQPKMLPGLVPKAIEPHTRQTQSLRPARPAP